MYLYELHVRNILIWYTRNQRTECTTDWGAKVRKEESVELLLDATYSVPGFTIGYNLLTAVALGTNLRSRFGTEEIASRDSYGWRYGCIQYAYMICSPMPWNT